MADVDEDDASCSPRLLPVRGGSDGGAKYRVYVKDSERESRDVVLHSLPDSDEKFEVGKKLWGAIFALENFFDNEEICKLACHVLLCMVTTAKNVRDDIAETEAIELVLDAMERHPHSEHIQRAAALMLMYVCREEDIRQRLGVRAVNLLFRLLATYKDSHDTQAAALSALAFILSIEALCAKVCTEDRIELVLSIIRTHRQHWRLLVGAFGLLKKIAAVERFRSKLGELGAILFIARGMIMHRSQRTVLCNGCFALTYIALNEQNGHRCLRVRVPELMFKLYVIARKEGWSGERDLLARLLRMLGVTDLQSETTSLHLAAKMKGDNTETVSQLLCGHPQPLLNKMVGPYAPNKPKSAQETPASGHAVEHVGDAMNEKEEPNFKEIYFKPLNVNVEDGNGRTPLHIALGRENYGVVEYLMKVGADPTLPDKKGNSVVKELLIRRDERAPNPKFDNGANIDRLMRMAEEAYVRKHSTSPYAFDVVFQKGHVVRHKPRVTASEVVHQQTHQRCRQISRDSEYEKRIATITDMRMMTEAIHRGHVQLMCLRSCLANLLIDVVDNAITSELDPSVFCLIASYCDLGSFQRHVRQEELDRLADQFVRDQRRLCQTFIHDVENGDYKHSGELGLADGYSTSIIKSEVSATKLNENPQYCTTGQVHSTPIAASAPKRPPAVRQGQRADTKWAPFTAKVAELGLDRAEEDRGEVSS